jgi:hypothetical protein
LKPKNLLFDTFRESSLPGSRDVFVLCKNGSESTPSCSYIEQIKEKFDGGLLRFISINSVFIGNEHFYIKDSYDTVIPYDIVIPDKTYDMDACVKRDYEQYALWRMKFKYYVIHENTYGYVRLATKFDLFYRLYLRNIVLFTAALLIAIPIGLITGFILLYDWLKKRS